MCVGTAASMDGYTAFGASIEKDGLKQTLSCPAPKAVVADLEILAERPRGHDGLRVRGPPGQGDLGGRLVGRRRPGGRGDRPDGLVAGAGPPARVDRQPGRAARGGPAGHRTSDGGFDHVRPRDAVLPVFENGLGRRAPVQPPVGDGGAGHGDGHEPPLSHGFKVGVGSVAIAALYERILQRDLADLDIEALSDSWPTREEMEQAVRAQHTSPELEEGAVEQTLAKYISADELAERLGLLREVWPGLREKVREQLMPAGADKGDAARPPVVPRRPWRSGSAGRTSRRRTRGRRRSASATPSSTSPSRPASSTSAWKSCSRLKASGAAVAASRAAERADGPRARAA